MNDMPSWSLYIGRWRRVHVRIHAIFVAVAVFAMFLASHDPVSGSTGFGLLSIAILLASVLAHESGHCFAAARVGGSGDQIVIGPLGGLGGVETLREPQSELMTTLAGPLVTLGILLLVLPVLVASGNSIPPLLSPLEPVGLFEGAWWAVLLKLTFWMNWLILIVNLLPAFPLDGARILRTMLWPALDYRSAGHIAVRASKLTALGVCLLAWLMRDVQSAEVLPAWVPLLLFATFIYFSAQYEAVRLDEGEWDEEMLSYDFSQGYTSLERPSETPRSPGRSMRRWLKNRRESRRKRRLFQEQEEERQVDEILLRLHESGMNGLTAKERSLLNRVSARYRSRQRS